MRLRPDGLSGGKPMSLTFDEDELDALIISLSMIALHDDEDLAAAAQSAREKIEAVLPAPPEPSPSRHQRPTIKAAHQAVIQGAIRAERKLLLHYRDKNGSPSERVIWPVELGAFEIEPTLAAWCESRADFRHFRLDRIVALSERPERLPRRHRILLAEWRVAQQDEYVY